MNKHIYEDKEEVARALAHELISVAEKNTETLYVALSGGSTPGLLFSMLGTEYRDRADWSKMHFFWGDDRCVPPDHAESNYGVVKKLFFDKVGLPEANIHRVRGELTPEEANQSYAEEINKVVPQKNGYPSFDITILGMGDDGHTASIFPDNLNLLNDEEITAVATHPKTGQKRITLTGKVLNNSKRSIFLVTGKGKAERIREISHGTSAAYPAAYIKSVNGPAEWYLDREAASLIQ